MSEISKQAYIHKPTKKKFATHSMPFEDVASSFQMLRFIRDHEIEQIPLDLDRLLELANITAIEDSFNNINTICWCTSDRNSGRKIIIDQGASVYGKQWAIGVGLGCYCLFRDKGHDFDMLVQYVSDNWLARTYSITSQFALEILLPEKQIYSACKTWNYRATNIACAFRVPLKMCCERLKQLNLL